MKNKVAKIERKQVTDCFNNNNIRSPEKDKYGEGLSWPKDNGISGFSLGTEGQVGPEHVVVGGFAHQSLDLIDLKNRVGQYIINPEGG